MAIYDALAEDDDDDQTYQLVLGVYDDEDTTTYNPTETAAYAQLLHQAYTSLRFAALGINSLTWQKMDLNTAQTSIEARWNECNRVPDNVRARFSPLVVLNNGSLNFALVDKFDQAVIEVDFRRELMTEVLEA